jgi:hypothetical protein
MAVRLSTGLVKEMLDTASFRTTMNACVMRVYTGSQPADADSATSGTLLCTLTAAGADNAPLTWATTATGGTITKGTEAWSGTVGANGTAGWFRISPIADNGLASTTFERMDGSISTAGAEINLSNLLLEANAPVTVTQFSVQLPRA